jgi:branched-chain amino acid transport system permease protein
MTTPNEKPSAELVAYARLSPALFRCAAIAAILAIACILPFAVSGYRVSQVSQVLIYAIAMLGLNILTGFNGQISLGQGAFYAIGAYTTASLLDKTAIPYWAAVPIAGAICLGAGFLFGLPALRLEGLYLALATLALAVATPQILKFKGFDHWTGGVQGIQVDLPGAPFGLPLNTDRWIYYFCLIWTIGLVIIARNLLSGRTGRAMIAIRDHPLAAATMGVDIALYKSLTFGVSAMYTGIAGALGALLSAYVSPDSFPVFLSIKFLVGSVVGGIVSISGAFIGALFIEFTPNFADQLSKAAPDAIFGMFLIALMYLMPKGAIGVLGFLRARFRQVAVAKNILLEPTGNLAENGEGFRRRGAKRSQGAARISKE